MKRKSIDAWLIEDKNNPQYYISRDISVSGKVFGSTIFGTFLYASRCIAEEVGDNCNGKVIPIKIVFKHKNIISRIGSRLRIIFTNTIINLVVNDMEDIN